MNIVEFFFDETRAEDWENIISICPVGAIKKDSRFSRLSKLFSVSLLLHTFNL